MQEHFNRIFYQIIFEKTLYILQICVIMKINHLQNPRQAPVSMGEIDEKKWHTASKQRYALFFIAFVKVLALL